MRRIDGSLPCSEWGLLALGLDIRSVVNTLLFGGLANLRTRYCAPGGLVLLGGFAFGTA